VAQFDCHPEQALFAQRGIWASRAMRRVLRDEIIARLARFRIKLSHYQSVAPLWLCCLSFRIETSMLTGSEIRRKFLDYFVQKGHREVHSSSLVPANDPTLLFTNAGMNQFKDVFLGLEKRDYTRATTSQKCVRAGGKHNDLENVGFTNRHHTFFEMLGNFSFGDYYKEEAIGFAWELLTSKDWFGIDKDKLYVTIFGGARIEPYTEIGLDFLAQQSWKKVGVPTERIIPFSGEKGLKENFWQMGDTGPCGPCSEIHYDMGPAASDQGHTDCTFGCDCGRYVELWNLVFMQFDRDASGKLNPLPKPSIDTGMGLERVAAVLQGVISNYDTDLFTPLIKRAAELTGASTGHVEPGLRPGRAGHRPAPTPAGESPNIATSTARVGTGDSPVRAEQSSAGVSSHKSAASLRVIADHSRAATFLISDGVLPSNEGRGYVLRKIIRRAITHGRLLGQTKPFLHEMVLSVKNLMVDAYPELDESADQVSRAILSEEGRFARTLDIGLGRLEEDLRKELASFEEKNVEYGEHIVSIMAMLAEAEDDLAGDISESVRAEAKRRRDALQSALANIGDKQIDHSAAHYFQVQEIETKINDATKLAVEIPDERFRGAMQSRKPPSPVYAGEKAFKLYDTFGMPLDFMQDAAHDQGIRFDQEGFDRAMAEQRERARASWKGTAKQSAPAEFRNLPPTIFEGYQHVISKNCSVRGIFRPTAPLTRELDAGEQGEVILDHTPFYAEAGGQVGDVGWFYDSDGNTVVADVLGCFSPFQGVRFHRVRARHRIEVGDIVTAVVNTEIRQSTMRNHTATHLLQAGLREVLGKHVKQAGSLVAPNHLRFDFSHFTAVEDEELQDIEDLINKEVLRNQKVEVMENVPIDVAINEYKAMALFGEKYGDRVRVIKIGDFSTELCGGTHTAQTGEIGLIKILKEGSVSSGVRRVEAVTGEGSLQHFRRDHELENVVASLAAHSDAVSPAEALQLELEKKDSEIKKLQRELDQARMKSASSSTANLGDKVKEVHGVKVLAHRVDNLERAQMRTLVDQLRDKLGSGVVVLGSAVDGNVALIVGVTKDLTSRIQAGKVIGPVAQKVGGKGGGRPDLAEAGGKDPGALDSALAEVYTVVESLLKA
jgi:alanyl-tRNA synthetase